MERVKTPMVDVSMKMCRRKRLKATLNDWSLSNICIEQSNDHISKNRFTKNELNTGFFTFSFVVSILVVTTKKKSIKMVVLFIG